MHSLSTAMHARVHPVDACPPRLLRQPFNLDRSARSAAPAALPLGHLVPSCRGENARLRGLRYPREDVWGALLRMGAIVSDGKALGCPGWARVSVGTQEEIEFFVRKLASPEVGVQEAGEGRPS